MIINDNFVINSQLYYTFSIEQLIGKTGYFCLMSKSNISKPDSALKVNQGIDQPSQINPNLMKHNQKFKKERISVKEIFSGIRRGDRALLSRGITLIESSLPNDRKEASELIKMCLPYSGNSVRIGITGVPGVGKSTFIETFGLNLIDNKKKVAVLAIDPSSTRTKGSILGDKTRMESLSTNPNAYIRPSASMGSLGGVARATREALILCEAAGFQIILIETVGVGQSETAVSHIVDFFLLLMLAGGGDELQGIKRGIMEMADLIVINKADGANAIQAKKSAREFKNALHLFPRLQNEWVPDVLTASAIKNTGVDEVWQKIVEFVLVTQTNGFFVKNRKEQALGILNNSIEDSLRSGFYNDNRISNLIKEYEELVLTDKMNPYEAAEKLMEEYYRLKFDINNTPGVE
jgi:LAO/AO transport system kinase